MTIVFEKIGYKPTFELARSLTDSLSHTPLGESPTNAQLFGRKHEKEHLHCFMDSAAFFGAFIESGLNVINGSGFVRKTDNALYTVVLDKHFNKNKLYIDIRNESEDSFNYYENYSNTIQWSLDGTDTLVDINYYRNHGWPLLIIDDGEGSSEFDSSNTEKSIKMAFPRGDNESPLVYYRRVYKQALGLQLPEGRELFQSPSVLDDRFSIEDLVPYTVTGKASANYFQFRTIRRVTINEDPTNNLPAQGFSLFQNGYLDGLFAIFDMTIPFDDSTGKSYTKIYQDAAFVNKKNVNGG